MNFTSDNWAGAHEAVVRRMRDASHDFGPAYETGALDRAVKARFREIFEHDVEVFFVGTGTAANALGLAAVQKPGGVTFCHAEAHVVQDECGAPDFFSGMRMVPLGGRLGKVDPEALRRAVGEFAPDAVHHGRAAALTLSQATELGLVYDLEELGTLGGIARSAGLAVHMDGARFANALVRLDVTPAEMTWKRGVDILSFGATKNGCWCAEAVVVFDPKLARDLPFLQKRGAQLFSKSRFIAAQFAAYFSDGLWLSLAGHANRRADELRAMLAATAACRLPWPTETNEVFAALPRPVAASLRAAGAHFYDWPVPVAEAATIDRDEALVRLVTSFATTGRMIEEFARALASA